MVRDHGPERAEHLLDRQPRHIEKIAQEMGAQIANDAAAGALEIVAPGVLQLAVGHEVGVEVEPGIDEIADVALLDRLPGQDVHRVLDEVEADEGRDPLRLGGLLHLAGQLDRVGERLLAIDVLAAGDRRHRHVEVHVVGRADVDDVDGGIVHELPPVADGVRVAIVARGAQGEAGVDVRHGMQHGHRRLGAEGLPCRVKGHGMDLAHPAGTDEANPQLAHRYPLIQSNIVSKKKPPGTSYGHQPASHRANQIRAGARARACVAARCASSVFARSSRQLRSTRSLSPRSVAEAISCRPCAVPHFLTACSM